MEKKKIIVPIVAGVATLGILTAASYAFFSATVTKTNETQTIIKSNTLGLEYTGVTDINITDIIPGDSMTKTFTVKNTSSHAVDYNIYMEDVENEFNEDLVYSLTDQDGTVIEEGPLPVTATGKTYIKSKVSIDTGVTKSYTLTIKFLYKADEDQNALQGKSFNATLGIDTEGVATPSTPAKAWTAVTGDGSQVGDEIAVGDEHFYVISNDGTTLNALAKYNLNAGGEYNGTSWTAYESTTGIQDSTMRGYVAGESIRKGTMKFSDSESPTWNAGEDGIEAKATGTLHDALDAYKATLPEGTEVRLITKSELEGLGCSGSSCSGAPTWVYSTVYWSGSALAISAIDVWTVGSNGVFGYLDFYFDNDCGVRPVISLES